MKITIVTVTYNAEKLLEQTILSIINQTYEDIEYIIIDGNSTDRTVEIIKKYEDKISYWNSEVDEGIYHAMNKAIRIASGEFINFMNAGDTFADYGTIKYIMEHKSEDAELIYGNHLKRQSGVIKKAKEKDKWYTVMPFCHQTLFTESKIMKEHMFDTHYKLAADYDFIIKMYHQNKVFCYIDKITVIFDEGGFAISNSFLMYVESLKVLTYIGLPQKEIEKSWWYKSLQKDMNIEKEKKLVQFISFYKSIQIIKKATVLKQQFKKHQLYKKIRTSYYTIRKYIIGKFKKNTINIVYSEKKSTKYQVKPFSYQGDKSFEKLFTVVSAVYNSAKYLDDYFKTITEQTLCFEQFIYIILIDDGSTDESANIIHKWKLKFPNNISYIKKENGGASSARNLGLKYVKTEWVTFIDSDDMINNVYFEEVSRFLEITDNIDLISCNQMFYIEETSTLKDHYLSYRFKEKAEEKIINPTHMQGYIQTTVNSVFFRNEILNKLEIVFNEEITLVYEDGHFINQLFLKKNDINIAFLSKPLYFYRKRLNNSSIMNTAWHKSERYSESLKVGLLDLFKKAKLNSSTIPVYLQRFVLYHIYWYFKKIVNHSKFVDFLTEVEIRTFKNLLEELFRYIDSETIEYSALGGLSHKYRVGFYKLYKDYKLFRQVCYLDSYDSVKKLLKVHYFYHAVCKEIFFINDKKIEPVYEKVIEHYFLEEIFVYEKVIFIPLEGLWEYLDVELGEVETQISLDKKRYKRGIQLSTIYDKITE